MIDLMFYTLNKAFFSINSLLKLLLRFNLLKWHSETIGKHELWVSYLGVLCNDYMLSLTCSLLALKWKYTNKIEYEWNRKVLYYFQCQKQRYSVLNQIHFSYIIRRQLSLKSASIFNGMYRNFTYDPF